MKIDPNEISDYNQRNIGSHQSQWELLKLQLEKSNFDPADLVKRVSDYKTAVPSWALGAGGTRFGRFGIAGEPANLENKIEDVALLKDLSAGTNSISLHIPWDIPKDATYIKKFASERGISFDAVNSNTFQDQPNQKHSYQFGSLCHTDQRVRDQAIAHNCEVIDWGESLGSKALTVWLADGTCFPGQANFRGQWERTLDSLKKIYAHLPKDWKVLVEYKPYEPNFYSTVIQDWGTALLLADALGDKAFCLVDLGHHLPHANIEQIVATLLMKGKLGGFHFNDSKYGDDDLTVGSINPYALFLIFYELRCGMDDCHEKNPDLAWMIDASHNLKDPLEDLLQSLEAIKIAYAKALLVDKEALEFARNENDVTLGQEILQNAYLLDVRPLLREARLSEGAAIDPIDLYRERGVRAALTSERGVASVATGL